MIPQSFTLSFEFASCPERKILIGKVERLIENHSARSAALLLTQEWDKCFGYQWTCHKSFGVEQTEFCQSVWIWI
jgi:hypothetical protein